MYFVKKHGIRRFVQQQNKRIRLLQTMINEFDDGRSRSFFCRAALLHDPTALAGSIKKATKTVRKEKIRRTDRKAKAKILTTLIDELAAIA